LLSLGGKRLRPICVALSSQVGRGFGAQARKLAVAVELVHSATLLHDDVVDDSDIRRGEPAPRTIYGNAASIFAGDWLLIEALRCVQEANVPGVLDRLLNIIEEMIFAESAQLEARGKIKSDRTLYFHVVEGKTASLFRWALYAGGKAGELSETACDALEGYGRHLGVAFQLVDDLLDWTGRLEATGKRLFGDIREGKITYPLIIALERDATLRPLLEQQLAGGGNAFISEAFGRKLLTSLEQTGGLHETRVLAKAQVAKARNFLSTFDSSRAIRGLETVAEVALLRQS
jgi:octaprenyl-diphosphate synthase